MDTQSQQVDPIHVAHLAELIKKTPAILKRINATANGGRLFLSDPIRLLGDVRVVLTPEATVALEEALGLRDVNNPLHQLYDDFKRDAPDAKYPVVINGIVPSTLHHESKHGTVPGVVDA